MASFVPTKRIVWEAFHFSFHLKKLVAESRRFLTKAYGDYATSIATCGHRFQWFKYVDFDLDEKQGPGQPKKLEITKLEALLDAD